MYTPPCRVQNVVSQPYPLAVPHRTVGELVRVTYPSIPDVCLGSARAVSTPKPSGKRYAYYRCRSRVNGRPCPNPCLPETELEAQLLADLKRTSTLLARNENAAQLSGFFLLIPFMHAKAGITLPGAPSRTIFELG